MPQTPKVGFNFKNLNVQSSVPLLGVTNVVARTTKGPFEDPSTLITSPAQFARIFGSEIVPDGSVSNIERALLMGSKVRVSRVAGQGATYGWAKPMTVNAEAAAEVGRSVPSLTVPTNSSVIMVRLRDPADGVNGIDIPLAIRTREAGSPVIDNTGVNLDREFYLKLVYSDEPTIRVSIAQYASKNEDTGIPLSDTLITETPLFQAVAGSSGITPSINVNVFQNFIENAPNITLELIPDQTTGFGSMKEFAKGIHSNEDVISVLRQFSNWNGNIFRGVFEGDSVSHGNITDSTAYMSITEGNAGSTPTVADWISAYQASKEYYEAYQVILSHIHQHLPSDYQNVYTQVANDVHNTFEQILYVEVPKYAPGTYTPATTAETLSALKTLVNAIGPKKEVAYFGGGIKFYDNHGSLQKCDVLGAVCGLADTAASTYGPWYSFAGMNRGIVADAQGPVIKNLGGPGEINTLNEFAQWYMNLFVIKDTRNQGKRTMLWHNFTSNPINDSEKFLGIVRLNLYLKKNLRPILESYIEEPNTFDTWKRIYQEAKSDVLDDLVERNAITSYEWLGDQDAQSYDELQVNNEADVRQGKYHIVLKYKEVVPMQDIEIDVVIDIALNKSTGEISISQTA